MRAEKLKKYYTYHAPIYDLTRWSFLLGRKKSIHTLSKIVPNQKNLKILEIGCGTGKNLKHLATEYPQAEIYGIDLSESMLQKAQKKCTQQITLINAPYKKSTFPGQKFNLIICNYSLSMFDNVPNALSAIEHHLSDDGYLLVTDFHATPFKLFEKWMAINHVDCNAYLYHLLLKNQDQRWKTLYDKVFSAYGGLWSYYFLIKQKVKYVVENG
ncbi:MAG: class I SAM-dependent methyltransferase [Candidatus Latescibacteria bacterium]|jgi:S-adenosylmethionine-diacylgycerolhomoserine-N-methlytransferase|nr:class I SAM-dependent methyltransferase [Candidatus Latescibacterota bacterium]MBT4138793.1 class I SAM-dependent methyltransferase [Candidatus Latescibacterota bacterium]MBT5829987.1 class I SAM-dependent methyltransferase [Candidatus Latescibacterota bacterium]